MDLNGALVAIVLGKTVQRSISGLIFSQISVDIRNHFYWENELYTHKVLLVTKINVNNI